MSYAWDRSDELCDECACVCVWEFMKRTALQFVSVKNIQCGLLFVKCVVYYTLPLYTYLPLHKLFLRPWSMFYLGTSVLLLMLAASHSRGPGRGGVCHNPNLSLVRKKVSFMLHF